jgi:hypothetical protein
MIKLKFGKTAALTAALGISLLASVSSANSAPIEIPGNGEDISKNGTGPGGGNGNSPSDDFFRLQTVVSAYDSLPGALAPLPIPTLAGDFVGDSDSDQFGSGGLSGFDYAVLHYGTGPGGIGGGGGVEVFYLDGASSFDFPANGSGPNGLGGFSSIVLYEGTPAPTPAPMPDAGATSGLLGLGLLGIALLRRNLK